MLTKDELIELFSNKNRKLFLGEDIYNKCKRNGSKITRGELEKRLDFWKSNTEFTHIFKNCNVDDVAKICNFSPDKPVDNILDNKCYNDIKNNIKNESLVEANICSICYEYNKNSELPNRIGCGHYFHYSCLNEWLGKGNNSCPICRKPVNMLLGFPTQNNEELFKTIQKLDNTFAKKYIDEMKLFMSKDEIIAFKQIHKLEIDEESPKDLLLLFLLNSFLYYLISEGTSYISRNYDPYYTLNPTVGNLEDIVLFPTGIYFAYQELIILLSIFGSVLKKISNY